MSYDAKLAERIRKLLQNRNDVVQKKMFGGLAFLVNGSMCCGVIKTDLVVRVGAECYEQALREPHARAMDFTGRPLTGFVYVAPAGYKSDTSLKKWIEWGVDFVSKLPAKTSRGKRREKLTPV